MKELNAETKNQQDIDESDIHQLTLEDRYYCLLHLKYNPLKPKILLTRASVQTEARQTPLAHSKSLQQPTYHAPVQTEARQTLIYQQKPKIQKHRASVQTEAR